MKMGKKDLLYFSVVPLLKKNSLWNWNRLSRQHWPESSALDNAADFCLATLPMALPPKNFCLRLPNSVRYAKKIFWRQCQPKVYNIAMTRWFGPMLMILLNWCCFLGAAQTCHRKTFLNIKLMATTSIKAFPCISR